MVEDEVAFFQIGQQEDEKFEVFQIGKEFASELIHWPTKEKKSIFRFNGIYLELGQEQIKIERQTYSMLEWVGDIGGLFDGMRILAQILIAPISSYALKATMMTHFSPQQRPVKLQTTKVFCWRKDIEYKKAMDKAVRSVEKQMDLIKFMQR